MIIRRTEWTLTHASLSKLLALFDPDPERAAEQYECVRAHIIKMFEARGCFASHELADEVTDRIIRRIEAGEEIIEATFRNYFFGVARNVFREYLRSPENALSSRELLDIPDASVQESAFLPDGPDESEREMNCLEACLAKLPPETQRLIISYYDWEEGKKIPSRKRLAAELGVSLNSLRIRAHRIREELEKCATGCIEANRVR
jgi:RNA polymerase sigma factor (sigma-70 family)